MMLWRSWCDEVSLQTLSETKEVSAEWKSEAAKCQEAIFPPPSVILTCSEVQGADPWPDSDGILHLITAVPIVLSPFTFWQHFSAVFDEEQTGGLRRRTDEFRKMEMKMLLCPTLSEKT